MADLAKLKSLIDWPGMRSEFAKEIAETLGKLPKEHVDLQTKTVDEMQFPGYVRRRVNYFVDSWNRISAWVFIPEGKEETPGILCCHQQVPQGKDEIAGLKGDPMMALAVRYAERGYVTVAPDCITAGDRVSSRSQPFDTKNFYRDNPKMSALGKMLSDHRHAVDLLSETRRVDTARIGVIGHGLGAANALLLAAFDERIQACVASCGFTRFADDKDPERWARDEGFVLLPQLRDAISRKSFPFDWEHILAMLAPTPALVISTTQDAPFADPKSCEKAVKMAQKVYKALGAGGAIEHYAHDDGPLLRDTTLQLADDWFDRWL